MFAIVTYHDATLHSMQSFLFRNEAAEAFAKTRKKLQLFEQRVPVERKMLEGVERIATHMGPLTLMLVRYRDPADMTATEIS